MIKVSVIIPVYNVEKFLRDCIESVINQTLSDIEIICINDGSPDNSIDILNEYASIDPRITVISQENRGLSVARNRGMRLAKGKYLYFIDSDDKLLDPDALEVLYTKAEEKRYERCLYFELDGTTYLLDSIDKSLKAVDIEKLDRNLFIFKPEDNEYEYYGG